MATEIQQPIGPDGFRLAAHRPGADNARVIYRDELFQAHQRIQQLEQELYAVRAQHVRREELLAEHARYLRRPHAMLRRGRHAPVLEAAVPLWAWWPVLAVVAGLAGYLLVFGAVPPAPLFSDDMPYDWAIVSAVAGAAIYTLDVALRWRGDGERSALGRLIVAVAVVVSLPALSLTVFGLGPILGLVAAGGTAIAGLVFLVRWVLEGMAS